MFMCHKGAGHTNDVCILTTFILLTETKIELNLHATELIILMPVLANKMQLFLIHNTMTDLHPRLDSPI